MELSKKNLIIVGGIILALLLGIVLLDKKPAKQTETNKNPDTRDFNVVENKQEIVTFNTPTPTPSPILIPTFTPTPTQTPTPTLTLTPTPTKIIPTRLPTREPTATPTPDNSIKSTGVSLNVTELNLRVNEKYQVSYRVEPNETTDKTVTWSSSNSVIAIVNSKGKITAKSQGNSTITARTSNNKATSIKLTVSDNPSPTVTPEVTLVPTVKVNIYPQRINLNYKNVNLSVGQREQLRVNIIPENVTDFSINWSSSHSDVATVDIRGMVVAKSVGSATITAKTINDITATAQVVIKTTTPTKIPTKIPTKVPTKKPTKIPTPTQIPPTILPPVTDVKGKITVESHEGMQYILYMPGNYSPDYKWPLLVYLHGWEEDRDINDLYKEGHIPDLLRDKGYDFNAIIISPYIGDNNNSWGTSGLQTKAKNIIDQVVKKYSVNDKKISLTCHSDGCWGGTALVKKYPTFFSYLVAVASSAPSSNSATGFKNTKISYWYGKSDTSTVRSDFINAINKAGGHAELTSITGGHNIMKLVYINHKMIEKMITESR